MGRKTRWEPTPRQQKEEVAGMHEQRVSSLELSPPPPAPTVKLCTVRELNGAILCRDGDVPVHVTGAHNFH